MESKCRQFDSWRAYHKLVAKGRCLAWHIDVQHGVRLVENRDQANRVQTRYDLFARLSSRIFNLTHSWAGWSGFSLILKLNQNTYFKIKLRKLTIITRSKLDFGYRISSLWPPKRAEGAQSKRAPARAGGQRKLNLFLSLIPKNKVSYDRTHQKLSY